MVALKHFRCSAKFGIPVNVSPPSPFHENYAVLDIILALCTCIYKYIYFGNLTVTQGKLGGHMKLIHTLTQNGSR